MVLEKPISLSHRVDGRRIESSIVVAYIPEERCVHFRLTVMGNGKHGLLADRYFESYKEEILVLIEAALLNADVNLPCAYRYRGVIFSDSYAKITGQTQKSI